MTKFNRRIDFTTEARREFREALRFSRRRWGEEQRDRYAQKLTGAPDRLAQFPELGERRDDLSIGLRSFPVEQHIIFYRIDDHAITVTRVLHVKMNATGLFDVN